MSSATSMCALLVGLVLALAATGAPSATASATTRDWFEIAGLERDGQLAEHARRDALPAVLVSVRPGFPAPTRLASYGSRPESDALPPGAEGALALGLEAWPDLASRARTAGALQVEAPLAGIAGAAGIATTPGAGGAPLDHWYRFVFPAGTDVRAAARELGRAREVAYAESEARFRATSALEPFLPNDPLFVDGSQWGLRNTGTGPFGGVAGVDIDAPDGWSVTTGSTAVVVGIVDTGIDLHHPELNPVLADGSPRVIAALNASAETAGTPDDSVGHGTFVAGVTAALTNNGAVLDGRGVAGVCGGSGGDSAGCRLVSVKATPDRRIDVLGSELARAILFAVQAGARCVNLSFGGDEDNAMVREAIEFAAASGVTVICAAGNGLTEAPQYPGYYARYGLGVSVAALRSDGSLAPFSSRGPQIDVAAPGENIYSTYLTYENAYQNPTRNFVYTSGTSLAAPFVTGLAGLALTLQPSLTDNEFQHFLRATAEDWGAPGRDDVFGYGIPHAGRLLRRLDPERGFQRGVATPTRILGIAADSVILGSQLAPREGCELTGRYAAQRWEVRARVDLPAGAFLEPPEIIVRTLGTRGWSPDRLHEYDLGWGEIVPGSVTASGFELRTFVYRIGSAPMSCPGSAPIEFLPVPPEGVRFAWSAFGRLDRPAHLVITEPASGVATWPVDRVATLRWEASDPDTITSIEVAITRDAGRTWTPIATLPGGAREFAFAAPCALPGEVVRVRVRATDARGALDVAEDSRMLVPERACRAGESPDFALEAIRPNPVVGSTVFRVRLPLGTGSGPIALVIYDSRGRAVRRLAVTPDAAGLAELSWDGTAENGSFAPSGVYHARLEVAGRDFVRRFVRLAP